VIILSMSVMKIPLRPTLKGINPFSKGKMPPLFGKEGSGEILKYMFLLLMLGMFAFSTVKRNTVWRDGFSLWSDTIRKMPESSRGHNNLGLAYHEQERFNDAMDEYQTAIRVGPDNVDAHNNLGLVYYKQGRLEEAIKKYQRSLGFNPKYHIAHNNWLTCNRGDSATQWMNIRPLSG